MKRFLCLLALVVLSAGQSLIAGGPDTAKLWPHSLQDAKGFYMPTSSRNAPVPPTSSSVSKGFSVVTQQGLTTCIKTAQYPAVGNVFLTSFQTGDAQDRAKVSFSGMAEIASVTLDGIYLICQWQVQGDPTWYGCPVVNGQALYLTGNYGFTNSAVGVSFTTFLQDPPFAANKQVTVSIDITNLVNTNSQVCYSNLYIER